MLEVGESIKKEPKGTNVEWACNTILKVIISL